MRCLAVLPILLLLGGASGCGKPSTPGTILTYSFDVDGLDVVEATGRAFELERVLARSLAKYGVSDVDASLSGGVHFRVPTRDPKDIAAIKKLLAPRGVVEFRIVAEDGDRTEAGGLDIRKELHLRTEDLAGYLPPRSPDPDYPGFKWLPMRKPVMTEDSEPRLDERGQPMYREEPTLVRIDRWNFSGRDLEKISVTSNPNPPGLDWVVNFGIRDSRERDFASLTGPNSDDTLGSGRGRRFAIILDGVILSAPALRSELTDGGYISGAFTEAQAEELGQNLLFMSLLEFVSETED